MAFNLGDIIVTIKAKTDDLQRGLAQVEGMANATKGFADKASAYMESSTAASKKFALGVTATAAAVVAFGVSSVKAFEDSETKIAQTNAVLKSTGAIAGVTADQVTKLASALERQTKFSDEDVRSVENLLLTFTSIGKDIFPQATKTVLDMATALGEDTSSASIQLGKALQDPILGITALRRVGVNFSDDQKKVIEQLVETGHKAEAQKLILKELNTEFGGSAEAAGNTLAGSLAKLKNQFNNVQEAIGGILATVAVPFLTKIMEWFNGIGGVDGAMKLLREELDKIRPYFGIIGGAIAGALLPWLIASAIAAGEFVATLAPWALLGIAVVEMAKKMGISWGDVGNALKRVKVWGDDVIIGMRLIKDTVSGGDPTLKAGEERFAGIARALVATRDIVVDVIRWFQALWNGFINSTPVIIFGQFLSQVFWPALQAIAAAVWQNLLPALLQLWDALGRLWNALNPALMDALKIVGAILFGVFLVALWAVASALNIAIQIFAGLISVISNVINWVSNLIGWFGNLVGVVWNAIKNIASVMWNLPNAFKDVIGTLVSVAAGIGGLILKAVGSLGSVLYNAGKSVIEGLIKGIKDKFGDVKDTLQDLTHKLTSWKGPEDVDSKILFGAGTMVIGGFVDGLQASFGRVRSTLGDLTDSLSTTANLNVAASVGNMLGASQLAGVSNTTTRNVSNVTNIDTINIANRADADYLLEHLDRNQQLEGLGLSPR